MSTSVDKLNLDNLPDYGAGSSPVLAPDGKGVIRGGVYISLEPGKTNMSYSERRDLEKAATKNTDLLVAQQELEENGTPIAETLGLKQPGDKNFDRDDRDRIQEAEFAASRLVNEQSDIAQFKYEQKRSESGPSAIELHNQIFGGNNAPGSIRQDEKGDYYAVVDIAGTNATGRDYSIDPKDNSQGPTFGGNVSKNIEKMFPGEVAAAGGSSAYKGSILDTFKDTDVPSQNYQPATTTTPQGNSFTETLANIFTPFDGTTYENGVLVSTTTGFPVTSDADRTAGEVFADSMKGAGILGISGKQVPDAPFTQGNTPILEYTGGDDDTRSYEVVGGLDPNLDPSMSYNEDNSLFVPYDGKDPYSFDASTNFPGSTDPNSPDYNMSKDLAETGSYYTFEFDESGAPKTDADGNYIIDTSNKIDSSFDNYQFQDNIIATLHEEGKAHLLATGDDSKMIVKGPGGSYVYLDGQPVLNPTTDLPVPPYDPTGGGPIFVQGPTFGESGPGTVLVDPITLDPVYPPVEPPIEPPVEPPIEPPVEPPIDDPLLPADPVEPGLPNPNLPFAGSTFYGGYQPVTASDVLVANALAETPYVPTTDPRFMPMFKQGANIDTELGIASLFTDPASEAMYQGIMS